MLSVLVVLAAWQYASSRAIVPMLLPSPFNTLKVALISVTCFGQTRLGSLGPGASQGFQFEGPVNPGGTITATATAIFILYSRSAYQSTIMIKSRSKRSPFGLRNSFVIRTTWSLVTRHSSLLPGRSFLSRRLLAKAFGVAGRRRMLGICEPDLLISIL